MTDEDCAECCGSGNCEDCNGDGVVILDGQATQPCESCNGSGECHWCDGMGFEEVGDGN